MNRWGASWPAGPAPCWPSRSSSSSPRRSSGSASSAHSPTAGFDDPSAESSRAGAAEQETFPDSSADLVVIYSSPDLTVADPAFAGAVQERWPGSTTEAVRGA